MTTHIIDSITCDTYATTFFNLAFALSLHLSMQYMLSVLPFLALKHPAMHSSFSSMMDSRSLVYSMFGVVVVGGVC
jgi:hypothetical protein